MKFKKLNSFSHLVNLTKISNLFSNSGMIITIFENILILLFGIKYIIAGELTIGKFTIIGTCLNIIISSIEYCLSFLDKYQNTLVSY